MRKYRLQNPTTPEDLEMKFSGMDGAVLEFGENILVAGFYWNGPNESRYFAAVYEYLDDGDFDSESMIGIKAVTDVEFEDDGHAIQWAMQNA